MKTYTEQDLKEAFEAGCKMQQELFADGCVNYQIESDSATDKLLGQFIQFTGKHMKEVPYPYPEFQDYLKTINNK